MALPPPQESAPDTTSRDLPVTYRNPWQTLGENLQAVVADLGLRARELVRRNGQGSLWRPSWWPVDLAPLFWPLLLALGLALTAWLSGVVVMALRQVPASPSASFVEELDQVRSLEKSSPGEPPAVEPPPPVLSEEPTDLDLGSEPTGLDVPEQLEQEPTDPLDALLQRPEAEGLLMGVRVLPDQITLVLELAPGFGHLARPEQQRLFEQWQQWAADLGYDHLELRDSRSGLLARDALVGSGMIVLSEQLQP